MPNCNHTSEIVRFSTPTLQINFKTINPESIAEAYLVFKIDGTPGLTKDLTAATVHVGTQQEPGDWIAWTLTQAETGAWLENTSLTAYCDWKLSDGTRGRSHTKEFRVVETGKDEVI